MENTTFGKYNFTKEEIFEFQNIWKNSIGEDLSFDESVEMAEELIETLYALTNGKMLAI